MSIHNIAIELEKGPLPAAGKALYLPTVGKYLIGWGPDNTAASDVILHIDTSMSQVDIETVLAELADGDIATLVDGISALQAEKVAQGAPTAKTTAVTLTAAELLTKIITATHSEGGDEDYTLPTGTLLDAAAGLAVGEAFDWSVINLSAAAADTVTITAATGHTLVGTGIVASAHATTGLLTGGNCARFRSRKTATNTFVTYRIG